MRWASITGAALAAAWLSCPPVAAEPPSAELGRLGGGYREAKWGMSPAEVKSRLSGRIDYETPQARAEKTLILDLGQGRKVTCYFAHDHLYQAIYQPIPNDGDQQGADAVLAGLEKKFGPGKSEDGFTDLQDQPLRLVTWNDGISKIEFRMRDPKAPGKPGAKPPPYPSSTLAVIYTGISLNAKKESLLQQESQRQEEELRHRKVQDLQGDL